MSLRISQGNSPIMGEEMAKQISIFDIPKKTIKWTIFVNNATKKQKVIRKGEKKMENGFSVDFSGEGKTFVKPFVDPDSYEATVVNVSDIFVTKNNFSQEEEAKISFTFELDGVQDKEGKAVRIPYYVRAKIVHAAKKEGFSDSKLYSLLEKCGKLEECKKYWQSIKDSADKDNQLANWLKTSFLGERAKVVTKTVVPKQGDKYSTISEVLKFLQTGEKTQETQEELVA